MSVSRARRLLLVAIAILALGAPETAVAHAGRHRTTLSEVEREVMCPTCGTTLQLASSPLAERQRAFILARVERDQTKAQIKAALVDEFGEQVLADPPRTGFAVSLWAVPLTGLALVLLTVAGALRRWRAAGGRQATAEPSPADRDRLAADLARFDEL